jgi:hypothetical protein
VQNENYRTFVGWIGADRGLLIPMKANYETTTRAPNWAPVNSVITISFGVNDTKTTPSFHRSRNHQFFRGPQLSANSAVDQASLSRYGHCKYRRIGYISKVSTTIAIPPCMFPQKRSNCSDDLKSAKFAARCLRFL